MKVSQDLTDMIVSNMRAVGEFMTKYPPIGPGQKVDVDWRHKDYRIACCDCNLVHTFRFAVVGNTLRIRAWREPHRTGALRRHRGIPIRTGKL